MTLMTKRLPMISLLAALFIISNTVNAISSVCQRVSDRDLCSKITKNAATWPETMTNAITYDLDLVKSGKSIIDGVGQHFPPSVDPDMKEGIVKICNKNYNDVVRALNECLGLVKADPDGSLAVYIKYQNLEVCSGVFIVNRIPVPSDLGNYTKNVSDSINVSEDLALARP